MRPDESRTAVSSACASIGVVLIIASALAPEEWYPAVALFAGLALLAVSHVLTPCIDQLLRSRGGVE